MQSANVHVQTFICVRTPIRTLMITLAYAHTHPDRIHEDEEHIFVKSNLKKRKVILNDIKWIEALGDYIKLVTDEANIVILSTVKSFEKQLPAEKFLRIHKSYIVNLEKVEKFNSKNVEVSGRSIPLSRNKKTELAEALSNV